MFYRYSYNKKILFFIIDSTHSMIYYHTGENKNGSIKNSNYN
jgi:hypothetical protein